MLPKRAIGRHIPTRRRTSILLGNTHVRLFPDVPFGPEFPAAMGIRGSPKLAPISRRVPMRTGGPVIGIHVWGFPAFLGCRPEYKEWRAA